MQLADQLRLDISTKLADHPEVRRAILFGSRARGEARERSDIDLALEVDDLTDSDWVDLVAALNDLNTLLEIDVINLAESPRALSERVQTEGVVLYDRNRVAQA